MPTIPENIGPSTDGNRWKPVRSLHAIPISFLGGAWCPSRLRMVHALLDHSLRDVLDVSRGLMTQQERNHASKRASHERGLLGGMGGSRSSWRRFRPSATQ